MQHACADGRCSVEGGRLSECAAAALSDLALLAENAQQIVERRGVAPLVHLVTGGQRDSRKYAAAALGRLSSFDDEYSAAIAEATGAWGNATM